MPNTTMLAPKEVMFNNRQTLLRNNDNSKTLNKVTNPTDLIKRYLMYIDKVEGVAKTTYLNRKYILLPFFDSFGVEDLRSISIQDVDDHLVANAADKKPSTLNAERQVLRSFFWFCQTYHNLEMQFDWSMVRRVRIKPPRIEAFTADEISRVITRCETEQDGLMIATLYESGIRIGELANLVADDLCGTQLQIRGKGEKDRVVFITDKLARALLDHMNSRCIARKAHVFQPVQHHWNHPNFRYGTCRIRERIQKQFLLSGYKSMHPHQLRHSFAISALQAGMDVRTLQKLLGHSNLDTTMRYLQFTDKHVEESYHKHFHRSVVAGIS